MTAPAVRSGAWFLEPHDCRAANRHCGNPANPVTFIGVRVVCLPLEVKPTQVAIRGGFHARLSYPWCGSAAGCRSACRGVCHSPDYAYDDIGFRVICLPPT